MVNKTLNGLASDYMRSMFTDRGGVTSYSLRDTECKLHVTIPIPRTNYRNIALAAVMRYFGIPSPWK